MIRIHTLGGCHVTRDGVRIEALTGQRKGLALLSLLAAAGERGVSRDVLVASLWPESDEERGRTSLRQLVHALRGQLAQPELVLSTAELRINQAVASSDVADFRSADEQGNADAAVALYHGPFLDGFHLKGADEFERWAAAERSVLAGRMSRLLERLAVDAAGRGDGRAAVDWWRRLVTSEPLSARATVGLMRALDAAGERGAALQHARVHAALVRQEVDGAPDATVTELAERLRSTAPQGSGAEKPDQAVRPAREETSATVRASTPADQAETRQDIPRRPSTPSRWGWMALAVALVFVVAVATFAGRAQVRRSPGVRAADAAAGVAPSVAVLPFVNTSGDPANEPLSDGLTDELIGALGRVPGLRVAGRTSVFALEGQRLDLRALGDTLGVSHVVEASVRRQDSQVKVTAQLVDVAANAILWSDTYDRSMTDVFAMQEEIAQSIVAALRVRLVGGAATVLVGRATRDPTAYELYLRGRHIFYTRSDRDATRQAARYFEAAVARDPDYARAHAGLADVYTRLAVFGFGQPREEFARAKLAARRALALDSTLAEAHTALAHALCVADFDLRGAERAFRRATALDPGYVFARLPFAICLMGAGRFGEAIAQLDTARATDPLAPAPSNVLGRVYVNARQPALAIRHLTQALELSPQMDLAYQQLGHAYLQQGRYDEAVEALRRAAALSGPRDSAHLAYAYAIAGRRHEAERIVRTLAASSSRRYVPPAHMALAYVGLQNADAAFEWLDRAFAERASLISLRVEPGFTPLHADPRWEQLLGRMRLQP